MEETKLCVACNKMVSCERDALPKSIVVYHASDFLANVITCS